MAKIRIVNMFDRVVEANDTRIPLLRHLHENGIDWMHACGAKGRCTTCKFVIIAGFDAFSHTTPAEDRYRKVGALATNERLACQVRVLHDCDIEVPSEYQLPYLGYGKN